MAVKPPTERPEPISSRINSVSSQFSDGGPAASPSARSSISSWSEEPAHSNMDISTGHMILVSGFVVIAVRIKIMLQMKPTAVTSDCFLRLRWGFSSTLCDTQDILADGFEGCLSGVIHDKSPHFSDTKLFRK